MSGKITELLVEEDSTVSVGQDLLRIEPGEGASTSGDEPPKAKPEGGARSEPKDLEEGNKDTAAPEAAKEKGADRETKQKQDEKAPGAPAAPKQEPAPRKEKSESAPPKKQEKPKAAKEDSTPVVAKAPGSRNETRVSSNSQNSLLLIRTAHGAELT